MEFWNFQLSAFTKFVEHSIGNPGHWPVSTCRFGATIRSRPNSWYHSMEDSTNCKVSPAWCTTLWAHLVRDQLRRQGEKQTENGHWETSFLIFKTLKDWKWLPTNGKMLHFINKTMQKMHEQNKWHFIAVIHCLLISIWFI